MFVVGQNTEHGYTQTEHLTICNVMFQPQVFDSVYDMKQLPGFQALFVLEPHYSQNYHFLSQLRLSPEGFTETELLLTGIMQDYRSKEPGWRDLVFAGFRRLAVLLARRYQSDAHSGNAFLMLADAVLMTRIISADFSRSIPAYRRAPSGMDSTKSRSDENIKMCSTRP